MRTQNKTSIKQRERERYAEYSFCYAWFKPGVSQFNITREGMEEIGQFRFKVVENSEIS